MEEIKKAKKLIEKHQNIHVLASPNFEKDSFPASLALFYALRQLGKNVSFLNKNFPEKYKFLTKKEKFHPSQADFLVSIKEAGAKLSQLFYEKTESGLNLFLKTDGGELKQENITLQPLGGEILLITVGVQELNQVSGFLTGKTYTVLNIDNSFENERYAQGNVVKEKIISLSEIVFDLLCHIDENIITEHIATALCAGIAQRLKDFNLNDNSLSVLRCLIEKGAQIKAISSGLFDKGFLKIFSRVLANIEKKENIISASIKQSDFLETETSPSDLSFSFQKLMTLDAGFFCLWEQNSSPLKVKGVFYSKDNETVKRIMGSFEGERKGNGFLFNTEEKDLKKVKDKILSIV